jgi:hypothetical protein
MLPYDAPDSLSPSFATLGPPEPDSFIREWWEAITGSATKPWIEPAMPPGI